MGINVPEVLKPFVCHGVDFKYEKNGQLVGDCPFCLKGSHFYVNKATGQWDCKVCGETGNIFTFLGKWAQQVHEETENAYFEHLSNERGIPAVTFRAWRLGWDGTHWLLPVVSEKKTTRDVRRYDPKTGTVKSTAGCHNQLYGAYKAKSVPVGGTIWVCEGEWDTIAWSYVLGQCGFIDHRAVGVPGAAVFKPEWVELFKGKHVKLCYDHDLAGRNGTKRAYEALKNVATSIQIINWPKDKPEGFDVRDFYKHYRQKQKQARTIFAELSKLLVSPDKIEGLKDTKPYNEKAMEFLESPPTFEETLTVYKTHLRMNQSMVDGLKILFATVLSADLYGDPLWIYIVSPPGGGKTALLGSLQKSKRVVYQSSITPHSLVSGCNFGEDPSLLPQLRNRAFVWKDFTEILSMHPNKKEELYGVLRGAYDGSVKKDFGNGVRREYHDVYFSMLAGVTPAIHGERQAALGERFLKYCLKPDRDPSAQIKAAIKNVGSCKNKEDELQNAAYLFLCRKIDIDRLPTCPEWIEDSVIALAQIAGTLRVQVDRNMYNESLKYRPEAEHATRLAAQLMKLGKMIAIVEGKKAIDVEIYNLLKQVGFDTATGFNIEIVKAIIQLKEFATIDKIHEAARIPRTNVGRILNDLLAIGAVVRLPGEGHPQTGNKKPDLWKLSSELQGLWAQAHTGPKPVLVKVKKSIGLWSNSRKTNI